MGRFARLTKLVVTFSQQSKDGAACSLLTELLASANRRVSQRGRLADKRVNQRGRLADKCVNQRGHLADRRLKEAALLTGVSTRGRGDK